MTDYFDYDPTEFIARASIVPARIGFKPGYESLSGRAEADLYPSLEEGIDPDTIYVFPAVVSNTRLDSYFTRMTPRTISNFVNALKGSDGVPFLDSHNTYRLPIGRSYNGFQDNSRGLAEAVGYFFIRKGINLGAGHSYATTNDYATAIDSRVITAVSVGFTGGEWTCDICGQDYWSEACSHVAGMTYGDMIATVTIDAARLAEVSAVWEGATPGATIQKALLAHETGVLTKTQARALSDRFGLHFPHSVTPVRSDIMKRNTDGQTVQAAGQPPAEDVQAEDVQAEDVQAEDIDAAGQPPAEDVQTEDVQTEAIDAAGQPPAEDVQTEDADPLIMAEYSQALETIRAATGQDVQTLAEGLQLLIANAEGQRSAAEGLKAEVDRLSGLAAIGETYRADLITSTLSEGVRAQGAIFPEDAYKALLQNATIDQIKAIRGSFETHSAAVLPTGAQVKTLTPGTNGRSKAKVPAAAFG